MKGKGDEGEREEGGERREEERGGRRREEERGGRRREGEEERREGGGRMKKSVVPFESARHDTTYKQFRWLSTLNHTYVHSIIPFLVPPHIVAHLNVNLCLDSPPGYIQTQVILVHNLLQVRKTKVLQWKGRSMKPKSKAVDVYHFT